jgi:hypothetical protein
MQAFYVGCSLSSFVRDPPTVSSPVSANLKAENKSLPLTPQFPLLPAASTLYQSRRHSTKYLSILELTGKTCRPRNTCIGTTYMVDAFTPYAASTTRRIPCSGALGVLCYRWQGRGYMLRSDWGGGIHYWLLLRWRLCRLRGLCLSMERKSDKSIS